MAAVAAIWVIQKRNIHLIISALSSAPSCLVMRRLVRSSSFSRKATSRIERILIVLMRRNDGGKCGGCQGAWEIRRFRRWRRFGREGGVEVCPSQLALRILRQILPSSAPDTEWFPRPSCAFFRTWPARTRNTKVSLFLDFKTCLHGKPSRGTRPPSGAIGCASRPIWRGFTGLRPHFFVSGPRGRVPAHSGASGAPRDHAPDAWRNQRQSPKAIGYWYNRPPEGGGAPWDHARCAWNNRKESPNPLSDWQF
jgi:hypothetical protein